MTDAEAPKRARLKKRTIAFMAASALTAGGMLVGIGPAAPWVVDHLGDGARVWRLGRIQLDGVHGVWLGALRAEHLSIADEQGVWVEADDVALDWRPLDLVFGTLRIESAHAASITMSRNPTLLAPRPGGTAELDVRIDRLRVDHVIVGEAVVDQAAQFTAALQLDWRKQTLRALDLNVTRTDSDADHIHALYRSGADYTLAVDVASAPGGVLARLLGVAGQGLRFGAEGQGTAQTGGARFNGAIGGGELLAGEARWTPAVWSIASHAQLDLIPRLTDLAERLGAHVALNASGARVGAFRAHAETSFFSVDGQGALTEDGELDGPVHFAGRVPRISNIAHESPFELGEGRVEGELRQARGTTAIQANIEASGLQVLGENVRLSGPVRAALTDQAFTLGADLNTPTGTPPLFAQARTHTELSYDRARGRFSLDRVTLEGDAVSGTASGWARDGDGEFAGEWRIKRLETLPLDITGSAAGRWRAFAAPVRNSDDHLWTTTFDGQGADIGGEPNIIPQLTGRAPRLDGRMAYEHNGITVSQIRINGAQLRAGATGRIVHGDLNLNVEASARGPLRLGDAEIAGAVDATGRLTGPLTRPTLAAQAQLSSFAAAGVVVAQPRVDFTLAPAQGSYRGRANVAGTLDGHPVTAASDIAVIDSTLQMNNLAAQLAGLEARGTASVAPHGFSAALAISGALDGVMSGVTGRVLGNMQLTPETLVLDAQIADAQAGELRIRAARVTASGPLNAIAGHFDMRGRLRQAPLTFAGSAIYDSKRNEAHIQGQGALADAAISTRTPIHARWNDGALEAELDMSVADGFVVASWSDRGRSLTGRAQIDDAPIAPLAAIWGERATGRIDGSLHVANAGGALSGRADVTLQQARFAGRQRGTLDAHVVADLNPSRLTATIDANSSDGLVAHLEADAPVTTSAAPLRVALASERRGRATWSVHGPAATLWAAARLQDQSLEGNLNGEGTLQFGAGYLAGDGQIAITNGRFEDKLTGVSLVNLDALVSISDRGVSIEHFTAAGPHGGRLTATGGSANPQQGSITVTLDDMRVADRPEARARGSGQLTLQWHGLNSSLSGDLNIAQADLDIAAQPAAGIATIDVVEINVPGDEDEPVAPELAAPRLGATTLDVHVRAPGRVFTRGRGLDAEWSLDLRLGGTAAAPQLFGEARVVRGQIALSGQPFELSDTSRLYFNGDPLDARIDLTAERDTADLTAYMRLTGTARDPDITFTSDPALPEDEILPQILFGRSVEDLSGLEAAQLAASLASLSGRASFDLVDAARAAAGLDRFNVRQDENGGFLVAGGVYLTREVYVEVARTGLGQAQTRVEWTIRPKLVLITSFLSNGDQRVSIRWRRESD